MIEAADIEQMSLEERLRTMELLWRSIAPSQNEVPSPDWHEQILASRLAQVARGEGQFMSMAELKERLRTTPT